MPEQIFTVINQCTLTLRVVYLDYIEFIDAEIKSNKFGDLYYDFICLIFNTKTYCSTVDFKAMKTQVAEKIIDLTILNKAFKIARSV